MVDANPVWQGLEDRKAWRGRETMMRSLKEGKGLRYGDAGRSSKATKNDYVASDGIV